jgi:hypothetical protein
MAIALGKDGKCTPRVQNSPALPSAMTIALGKGSLVTLNFFYIFFAFHHDKQ